MSDKISDYDLQDREIIKEFWKAKFGKELYDTDDSWFCNKDRIPWCIKQEGKYDIDLIAKDGSARVEIERRQARTWLHDKQEGKIGIVVKKFYKYFDNFCNINKSFMVYPIYNGDKYSGKVVVINGQDIKNNIDKDTQYSFQSDVTNSRTYVYKMPVQYAVEYDDPNFNVKPAQAYQLQKKPIEVSDSTYKKWIDHHYPANTHKYCINREVLDGNDDFVYFQTYEDKYPFQVVKNYCYKISKAKLNQICKLAKDENYTMVLIDEIKNAGELINFELFV